MNIPQTVKKFLEKQGYVIVSTFFEGRIHCAAKGIVGIEANGKVFVIDLYQNQTYRNIKKNKQVSITCVDEHAFRGYTLQGRAKIVAHDKVEGSLVKAWEKRIVQRISNRIIENVRAEKRALRHHEAELPTAPKYVIEIDVENIIDLSPPGKS